MLFSSVLTEKHELKQQLVNKHLEITKLPTVASYRQIASVSIIMFVITNKPHDNYQFGLAKWQNYPLSNLMSFCDSLNDKFVQLCVVKNVENLTFQHRI